MEVPRLQPSTQQPKLKTVGFHVGHVSHSVESLIYFIVTNPGCRVLLIAPGIGQATHSDHPKALRRLQDLERLEVVDLSEIAVPVDYLFFKPHSEAASRRSLHRWLDLADKAVLLYGGSRYQSWKTFLKDYIRSFPACLKAQAILIRESPEIFNPFPFIPRAIYQKINIHPQYIRKSLTGELNFFLPAPPPESPRPYRFVFVGNYNPPERQAELARIEAYFSELEGTQFVRNYEPGQHFPPADKTRIVWNSYGDGDKIRGLPGNHYRLAHEESDFSICPLGWGRSWTHRTVESLLRGAIPILEDISRYNLGLEDEKNCLEVRDGDWLAAIQRACLKTPAEIVTMRRNLIPLRTVLLPDNMGRFLVDRLP